MTEEIRVGPGQAPVPRLGDWRLMAGGAAFVTLTVGVLCWQFSRVPTGSAGPTLAGLRWGYLALLLLALPVESLAAALRMWLLCRVLHPGVGFGTCLRAEWANVAVSLFTPSQSGGGPGQIYVLNRGAGVSVGTGLTLSLLSFVGTMVGLLGMGLYALWISPLRLTGSLVGGAVWALIAISAVLLLGAAWPGLLRVALGAGSRAACRLRGRPAALAAWWPPGAPRTGRPLDRMGPVTARLADLLYTYSGDVRRFLRTGKTAFAGVCGLSVAFLLARALMPYLCARFLGVEGGSLREVLDAQIALIFLIFFAPTPGGAGIAEGASLSVMARIVPPGYGPHYTLLWRFSTVYVAALAGFLCLARVLAKDAARLLRSPSAPRWPLAIERRAAP
jgi:uncharacterized protein (TIRG00374 family)